MASCTESFSIRLNDSVWQRTNRKIDYWPFVSTIVNLAKIIFKGVVYFNPPSLHFFERWYITDLHSKSFTVCVLLLIPGVNIIVASARDIKDNPPQNKKEVEVSSS